MSQWYSNDWMKFKKVSKTTYVYGEFEIVNLKGYHFAFHRNYLINRETFSKQAAYQACLSYAQASGLTPRAPDAGSRTAK